MPGTAGESQKTDPSDKPAPTPKELIDMQIANSGLTIGNNIILGGGGD